MLQMWKASRLLRRKNQRIHVALEAEQMDWSKFRCATPREHQLETGDCRHRIGGSSEPYVPDAQPRATADFDVSVVESASTQPPLLAVEEALASRDLM
jgi:hypothetical protein